MPKDRMIATLGESHPVLPGLLAGELAANDCGKLSRGTERDDRLAREAGIGRQRTLTGM